MIIEDLLEKREEVTESIIEKRLEKSEAFKTRSIKELTLVKYEAELHKDIVTSPIQFGLPGNRKPTLADVEAIKSIDKKLMIHKGGIVDCDCKLLKIEIDLANLVERKELIETQLKYYSY